MPIYKFYNIRTRRIGRVNRKLERARAGGKSGRRVSGSSSQRGITSNLFDAKGCLKSRIFVVFDSRAKIHVDLRTALFRTRCTHVVRFKIEFTFHIPSGLENWTHARTNVVNVKRLGARTLMVHTFQSVAVLPANRR